MNIYILVEGRRTEKKIYPKWLGHIVPRLQRVDRLADVDDWNYFIFSGEGYPSLLNVHLKNAIKDFQSLNRFSFFCICLDVDDSTVDARVDEVIAYGERYGLDKERLVVIPQNCCIESWLLGNRKVVSTNPNNSELRRFVRHFDVRVDDPELMPALSGFRSKSVFHYEYMRHVARDKGFVYTKYQPGHAGDAAYLDQLRLRVAETNQMSTLKAFFDFCERINNG